MWIVGFPWYLSVRYKIKQGLVPLKEQPATQLETYVKEARVKGMTDDEIRQALLTSGWSDDDISKVLG